MTRRKQPVPDSPEAVAADPDPVVAEAVPEPRPHSEPSEPTIPSPAAPRQTIVWPLLGGALAAICGFGLSHFNVLALKTAPQVPDPSATVAALTDGQARIEDANAATAAGLVQMTAKIAGLSQRIAALEDAPTPPAPDAPALTSGLADLDRRLAAIEALPPDASASSAALAAKLAALESTVATMPTAGSGSVEVEGLTARVTALETTATAQRQAEDAAKAAAARAQALAKLADAVASGAGFADALAAVPDPDLLTALGPYVAGVAPLADLQASYPDAARSALQLARNANEAQGWTDRLLGFLAAQTEARPLTPQDGPAPEAILSRAEFALGEGRLDATLAELGTLPPPIRAPLEPWIAQATARVAVDAAMAQVR
jgi:hypothetical protein